jgi:hypothetical protein
VTAKLKTFTAFCRDEDGTGTVWIDTVEAVSKVAAKKVARKKCAQDWGWLWRDKQGPSWKNVKCIGIAKGTIDILFWEPT